MHRTPVCIAISLTLVLFATTVSADQGWGSVSGTLVLKGDPPTLPALDPGTDTFCCQADPQNESLVLGDAQAIANVIVYLRPPRGERVPIHPDYQSLREQQAPLDNKGCAFTPHVALLWTEQTLQLQNTDKVNHSIKGELGDEAFNFMLSAGGTQDLQFKTEQRLPRPVSCSIHPFMRAWLLVRDNPYMAVTDADGKFTIANLPAGQQELQFWHERPGYLKNCASDSFELDRRGRVTVDITDGDSVDLGTILVDATLMASEDE